MGLRRGFAVGLVASAIACSGCGSGGGGATGGNGGAAGGKGGGAAGKAGGSGVASGGAGGAASGAGGTAGAAGNSATGGHAGAGGAAGSAGVAGGAGAGGAGGSSGATGSGGAAGQSGAAGNAGAGGRAGAAGGGAAGASGPACLGDLTLDLISRSDLSSGVPYWVDASTACGAATFEDDGLRLSRDGTCTADQQGGFIQLDPTQWQLCGDFDMTVDFDLAPFSVPASGSRWLAWHTYDPAASSNGIALERYNVGFGGCYPSTMTYKSWTASSTDCSGGVFRSTTAVTGTLRVTRVGSTVSSYTQVNGDAGVGDAAAGGWSSFVTASGMTTTPWTIAFYTGVYNGDGTAATARLSNLVIKSASTP
jgi:hypothetical protein